MKSNFIFICIGVFCVVFCVNSTNGRHFGETKYKRQVEPIPEPRSADIEEQAQEKEEIKDADNVPAVKAISEDETRKSVVTNDGETLRRSNDVPEQNTTPVEEERKSLEEGQATVQISMEEPAPAAQIANQEAAAETPQASNKEEVVAAIDTKEAEKEYELKPAASMKVDRTVALDTQHIQPKSYGPYWTKVAQ